MIGYASENHLSSDPFVQLDRLDEELWNLEKKGIIFFTHTYIYFFAFFLPKKKKSIFRLFPFHFLPINLFLDFWMLN